MSAATPSRNTAATDAAPMLCSDDLTVLDHQPRRLVAWMVKADGFRA
jgi:hypothetical protein